MLTVADLTRRWAGPAGILAGVTSGAWTVLGDFAGQEPSVPAVAEPLALVVLTFLVARWAQRLAVAGSVVPVVALAVLVLRYAEAPELAVTGKVLAVGLWGGAGASVALAGWGLRGIARVRESARQAAEYRRRLELAAELHDFVAHDLSEVVAHAQAARYLRPEEVEQALERIERAGVRSLESLETTVRALHAEQVSIGGLEALPSLVEQFNAAAGPQVRLEGSAGQLTAEASADR